MELNWNMFEVKFNGKQQSSFERLAYHLFCFKFNQTNGIPAHTHQIGIETEPICIDGKSIGFQAKYVSPSVQLSAKKGAIIKSIELSKEKNPELNEVYIYLNKAPSESRKKGTKSSQYILDIESKAKELNLKIVWQVPSHIQKQLSLPENTKLAKEFFPEYHDFQIQLLPKINENELLKTAKTAIILLEIEKIKEEYYTQKWDKREVSLKKLYRYINHTNESIARAIFIFLRSATHQTRAKMPSDIASAIQSLVFYFFPSSYKDEKKERIENGKQCVQIGYLLVYDGLIHLNNFQIAVSGLSILKFIFREGERMNVPELTQTILDKFTELEQTLERPERTDLNNARELVRIFKSDLKSWDLSFPALPDYLYKLIQAGD